MQTERLPYSIVSKQAILTLFEPKQYREKLLVHAIEMMAAIIFIACIQ